MLIEILSETRFSAELKNMRVVDPSMQMTHDYFSDSRKLKLA